VNYTGLSQPIFDGSAADYITFCVPIDYNNDTFCGRNVSSKSPSFDIYRKQNNHCNEVMICGNNTNSFVSAEKRINATVWEKQNKIGDCIQYKCDNESGGIISNDCYNESSYEEDEWKIEMEIDRFNMTNLEDDIISMLCNATGIDKKHLNITIEMNENGELIQIVLYLDHENGKILEKILDECSSK